MNAIGTGPKGTSSLEVIHSVVQAPVVSHDSNSPEAVMARKAKQLEVQASTDSKYDTVLTRTGDRVPSDTNTMEGFSENCMGDKYSSLTLILLSLSLGFGMAVFYGFKKIRR
jgi:hypothetical protein